MGKAVDPALRQLLKRGGDFDPLTGLDLVSAAAKEQGLGWYVADCDKAGKLRDYFGGIEIIDDLAHCAVSVKHFFIIDGYDTRAFSAAVL